MEQDDWPFPSLLCYPGNLPPGLSWPGLGTCHQHLLPYPPPQLTAGLTGQRLCYLLLPRRLVASLGTELGDPEFPSEVWAPRPTGLDGRGPAILCCVEGFAETDGRLGLAAAQSVKARAPWPRPCGLQGTAGPRAKPTEGPQSRKGVGGGWRKTCVSCSPALLGPAHTRTRTR